MSQIPPCPGIPLIEDVEFEEMDPTPDLEYPELVQTSPILECDLNDFLMFTNRYNFRHG